MFFLRYEQLSLIYWIRLKGSVHNPSISVLSDCWEYTKKANGFGWNIDNLVNEYGLKELKYGPALALSCIPPWLLPDPEVNIDLLTGKSEHLTKQSFANACSSYLNTSFDGYLNIFTDGSKDPKGQCGIGIYIPEFEKGYGYRVGDFISILNRDGHNNHRS